MFMRMTYRYGVMTEMMKVYLSLYRRRYRAKRIKGHSSPSQKVRNKRARIKTLARLLAANFHRRSLYFFLTFDDDHLPLTWEDHEACMQKLMKRLAYIAKKNGIAAPRWIYVCSDYDAAKGVHVRRHVHLIISREGFTYSKGCWFFCGREFSNIWNNGVAIRRQMSEGPDYTYLAAYLVNQARTDKADVKSYHSSKNLYRPKPSLEVINASELLRTPLNAVVLDSYSTYLGYEYVKFFVPNKKNADDS